MKEISTNEFEFVEYKKWIDIRCADKLLTKHQ